MATGGLLNNVQGYLPPHNPLLFGAHSSTLLSCLLWVFLLSLIQWLQNSGQFSSQRQIPNDQGLSAKDRRMCSCYGVFSPSIWLISSGKKNIEKIDCYLTIILILLKNHILTKSFSQGHEWIKTLSGQPHIDAPLLAGPHLHGLFHVPGLKNSQSTDILTPLHATSNICLLFRSSNFLFAIGQTLNKTVPQNLGDIDLGENGYCRNSLQQ